jgi:hypothetical protein
MNGPRRAKEERDELAEDMAEESEAAAASTQTQAAIARSYSGGGSEHSGDLGFQQEGKFQSQFRPGSLAI